MSCGCIDMSIFGGLLKTVTGPILEGVLRFIPDKNKRAEAEEVFNSQMLKALSGLVEGQLKINEKEAEHSSIFVAGWRPWIGWVCGAAMAWAYLIRPMAEFGVAASGVELPPLPVLDLGEMMPVLLGMLGLGGLRTY